MRQNEVVRYSHLHIRSLFGIGKIQIQTNIGMISGMALQNAKQFLLRFLTT